MYAIKINKAKPTKVLKKPKMKNDIVSKIGTSSIAMLLLYNINLIL